MMTVFENKQLDILCFVYTLMYIDVRMFRADNSETALDIFSTLYILVMSSSIYLRECRRYTV